MNDYTQGKRPIEPPATIPGGWLDQDDLSALRVAARAQLNREHARAARMGEPFRAAMLERAARLERALLVLDDIAHGARVEALPSPEEEAAHEAGYRRSNEECACGHTRHWHGATLGGVQGDGVCEHGADCPCSGFVHA